MPSPMLESQDILDSFHVCIWNWWVHSEFSPCPMAVSNEQGPSPPIPILLTPSLLPPPRTLLLDLEANSGIRMDAWVPGKIILLCEIESAASLTKSWQVTHKILLCQHCTSICVGPFNWRIETSLKHLLCLAETSAESHDTWTHSLSRLSKLLGCIISCLSRIICLLYSLPLQPPAWAQELHLSQKLNAYHIHTVRRLISQCCNYVSVA